MSTPNQLSVLGKNALDAVVTLFLSMLTRPLRSDHVRFRLDTTTTELVVESLDVTADNETGLYIGQSRWPYQKARLDVILPQPLVVELGYPTTFRQLRASLFTMHGVVVEEGELALTVGGAALNDNDQISRPLLDAYGHLRLYATEDSGRFVAGSSMTLLFIQPDRRVPLKGLFDFSGIQSLDELASDTT